MAPRAWLVQGMARPGHGLPRRWAPVRNFSMVCHAPQDRHRIRNPGSSYLQSKQQVGDVATAFRRQESRGAECGQCIDAIQDQMPEKQPREGSNVKCRYEPQDEEAGMLTTMVGQPHPSASSNTCLRAPASTFGLMASHDKVVVELYCMALKLTWAVSTMSNNPCDAQSKFESK